jgi:altronate hydrolase
MDLNAGTIVDGEETIEQVGQRIFELVIRVAGGEPSKSEALGVGDHEFVPWMIGATM